MPAMRSSDPQQTVTATLKQGGECELLVFSIYLALFEIVCIVNIPPEGETKSSVYVKFKTRANRPPPDREETSKTTTTED